MMRTDVDKFCGYVNRRLYSMSAITQNELTEYLDDYCLSSEGNLIVSRGDVKTIAEILDVNTDCVRDIFIDEFNIDI